MLNIGIPYNKPGFYPYFLVKTEKRAEFTDRDTYNYTKYTPKKKAMQYIFLYLFIFYILNKHPVFRL